MTAPRNSLGIIAAGLLLCVSAQADDLGRLFTSPEQRAYIDDLRRGRVPVQENVSEAPIEDNHMVVKGVLAGSNGKRLVWINNNHIDPDQSGDALTLLGDGRVRLDWKNGDPAQDLKPGQGLDRSTGEVYETYTRAPAPLPTATPDATPAPAPEPAQDAAPAADAQTVTDANTANKADGG